MSSVIGLNVSPSTEMVFPLRDPPNAADTFLAMARLRARLEDWDGAPV